MSLEKRTRRGKDILAAARVFLLLCERLTEEKCWNIQGKPLRINLHSRTFASDERRGLGPCYRTRVIKGIDGFMQWHKVYLITSLSLFRPLDQSLKSTFINSQTFINVFDQWNWTISIFSSVGPSLAQGVRCNSFIVLDPTGSFPLYKHWSFEYVLPLKRLIFSLSSPWPIQDGTDDITRLWKVSLRRFWRHYATVLQAQWCSSPWTGDEAKVLTVESLMKLHFRSCLFYLDLT